MRTFLAVNLPPDERQRLHDALTPLRDRLPGVRWLRPDALHVTLKFLGEIEGPDVERIGEVFEGIVSPYEPQTISLGGVGAFPSFRRANIVWVGVSGGTMFERLQRDIETAASRLGFARDQRAFRGHITVGRAVSESKPASLERLTGVTEYTGKADVRSVDLMRTHRDAKGSRYETLARYKLGDGELE